MQGVDLYFVLIIWCHFRQTDLYDFFVGKSVCLFPLPASVSKRGSNVSS